jgi:hypothetical protein
VTIDDETPTMLEYGLEVWCLADEEPNTHSPQRYTQNLSLSFENLTALNPAQIRISRSGPGGPWETIRIGPSEVKKALTAKDIALKRKPMTSALRPLDGTYVNRHS